MTAIRQIISEHNTGDPDETTQAVFDALNVPMRWRELFWPLVRDQARRQQRNDVRALEPVGSGQDRPATQGGYATPTGSTTTTTTTTILEKRPTFLDERFYNDEQYVTWGEATIVDHEGRIAMQLRLRAGVDADITRHQWAIDTITEHGVDCLEVLADLLDELPEDGTA